MEIYKYSGAGNDFVVLDGRSSDVSEYRQPQRICQLFSRTGGFVAADGRVGADGLMILTASRECDFRMEFYNPDGSCGMMCGNGGRCIAAFADFLGIRPTSGRVLIFEAPDGIHTAEILSREGSLYSVRLRMKDVKETRRINYTDAAGKEQHGWFIDTGARHFVRFVTDLEAVDVEKEGRELRWNPLFAPEGTNVDFVFPYSSDNFIYVRTFEKGVEAETLACGTGIVASAIAVCLESEWPAEGGRLYHIRARRDSLTVEFIASGSVFSEVYLTGPALRV